MACSLHGQLVKYLEQMEVAKMFIPQPTDLNRNREWKWISSATAAPSPRGFPSACHCDSFWSPSTWEHEMHLAARALWTVHISVVSCTVSMSRVGSSKGAGSLRPPRRSTCRSTAFFLCNPARFSKRLTYRRCKRGLRTHWSFLKQSK